ncbi:MAG TPA: hypothetical protein VK968_08950, partial [Roseimicrobium sp.]|nr:hypothetical protein [Roseimicrobium sp.]
MKRLLPSAAALLLLAGCASAPRASSPPLPARTGDPVVDKEALMARAPAKDRVLWQYRTALTALRQGNFDEAKRLLDDAILTIGGILGKDATARKSRSIFRGENSKNFIGEPYERVMAYYYRGLLYWRDGEPDNARACYR